jgi:DNA-binding LacI/PurR family transcriptional regulator
MRTPPSDSVEELVTRRLYRKTTIKEVAELAGVSVTTVSHVVSGKRLYGHETQARVRKAIADLNYVPSYVARGLRGHSSLTIGVCADDPYRFGGSLRRTFAEQLWRGMTSEADAHSYSTLHYSEKVRESESVEPFLNGFIDGLLMENPHGDVRPAQLAQAGLPVVVLTRAFENAQRIGAVYTDEGHLVEVALEALYDQGHRRIAHIAGPSDELGDPRSPDTKSDDVAEWRLNSYRNWMANKGCDFNDLVGYAGTWEPRSLLPLLQRWQSLDDPPTAIFCSNDAIALRLMGDAKTLGIRVPEDISLVGVDNVPESVGAGLTTMRAAVDEVGREAVRLLLRMMGGEPAEACRKVLPVARYVERNSVAPLRQRFSIG